MSEPRYLFGDDYAYNGGYEELINCVVCSKEYDRVEYRSDTCSDCEDKMIASEAVFYNLQCQRHKDCRCIPSRQYRIARELGQS